MDTGNVEIYSYLMNGMHKLVQFQQVNALAATLGDPNSKRLRDNEATAKKKDRIKRRKWEINHNNKRKKKKPKRGSFLD